MPYIASKYVHYGILTVGFLTAIEALGIDLTKFSLIGGAIGVGLGLAIQAPIAHFVAGVLLLFERSIKVGDSIQIDSTGITGTVEQVGIRSSVVRTPSGSQIILPNSTLITNAVISWSFNSQRLIEIPITVSPKADLKKVMDLLLEVASTSDKVLQTPPPQALLVSVAGTALNFRLRVWVHADMDSMVVTSDLSIAVGRVLARENIPLN
jgi:small-conductance mechanosensitive channel